MSGETIMKRFPLKFIALAVLSLCLFVGNANAAAAAAKPVKEAAKTVAKAAPTPAAKKAVQSAATKIPTPPPMVGLQKIVAPDSAKNLVPDKSKIVTPVKSFTEALKELEKQKAKDKNAKAAAKPAKKKVKSRQQVIDALLTCWAKRGPDAESYANNAARKLVGNKSKYLVKDSVFIADSNEVICQLRINFTTQIPETWYLETEMTTGFGSTYERAYNESLAKAAGKANKVQSVADWANAKAESTARNGADMGVIPYSVVFATIGKEKYCKLYFRYFMPR